MGMFQPHNYASDFLGGMTAVNDMVNSDRRMKLEERTTALAEQRAARDDETHQIQREGLKLQNQKAAADLEREKKLSSFLDLSARMEAGQLKPEDYGNLAKDTSYLMETTPYLPSDPSQISHYKQSITRLVDGVQNIRNLPASNYQYSRDDNVPEVNSVLDSFQTLLSKDRMGKSFVDSDGAVTGTPGATYKTSGVGGFSVVSGEGDKAAFVPMFSVTDADGNPLRRQDGKQVLVPSTEGATNDPNAKVRMVTPEEMLTKAGYAYKVLDAAEKVGLNDPEKRKQYVAANLPYYMGEKGAEAIVKANAEKKGIVSFDPSHNVYDQTGKLIQKGVPKDKYMTVPEGGKVIDPTTGAVVAEGAPKDKAPTTRTVKNGGYEVSQEWRDGKWTEVGRNKIREPREPADPAVAEGKRAERDSKGQIDKALEQYNTAKRSLAAAQKAGDEDGIASAQQELADTKSAYINRASEHKKEFGREYNPIKEVVERKQGRDITPLKDSFSDKGGIFSRRDYSALVASAEAKGWTRDEIAKAAKGTGGESAVSDHYASKQSSEPAPKQAAAAKPTAQPTQKGKAITATNKQTGQRIVSYDNGASWQPMK